MLKKNFYNIFHQRNKVQTRPIENNNFTYINLLKVLDNSISFKKNTIILDIGCGPGTISIYLANSNKNIKVIAIDVSKQAITIAKKSALVNNIHNIEFLVDDFPNDYPAGKYTYIICFEVLEHIKNDKHALEIIYKLLDKNGLAFISVPSTNAPLYRLGIANDFDRKVGHLRRYSLEQITKLCEQVGFNIIETELSEGVVRNSLFLLPTFSWMLRFIKYFMIGIVTKIDNISLKIFGESQIILVVKK